MRWFRKPVREQFPHCDRSDLAEPAKKDPKINLKFYIPLSFLLKRFKFKHSLKK